MRIRTMATVSGMMMLAVGALAQAPAPAKPAMTSKFDASMYGYIKLDASYDTERTAAGDLMFYVLPEVNGKKDNEFNMTAKETRLGFDIGGPASDSLKSTGKIEADFYGPGGSANSPNLRLRLAYLDLAMNNGWSFRAGQDWETFITVVPKIVNFSYLADAGALGLRRAQARATKDFAVGESGNTKITAKLAAARTIGEDIDGGGQEDGIDAGMPSLQYNVVLQTKVFSSKPSKFGISGQVGRETLDDVSTNAPVRIVGADTVDYDTWCVIGSVVLPLTDKVGLQGTVWTGVNLDNYFGGIGQGINKTLQSEVAAMGGFAQVMLDVTKTLNWNLGLGIDDPDDDDLNTGNRSKNGMFFTSLYYSINDAATLAAEYSLMQTSYLGGDDASNNRLQLSAIYKF